MSDYFGKEIFTKCVGVFEKKKDIIKLSTENVNL